MVNIDHYVELLKHKKVILYGDTGLGKTSILKKSCEHVIDFSALPMVPELLASHIAERFSDDSIRQELEKRHINHERLIELSFEQLSKHNVGFDNFDAIMELGNFPQLRNILDIITPFITHMIPVTSRSSMFAHMLAKKIGFSVEELLPLSIQEVGEELHGLTGGNPLYVALVKKRMEEIPDVHKAFEFEVREGVLHFLLQQKLAEKLAAARGQSMLLGVLHVLGSREMRLSEIAEKLYRVPGVVNSLVQRLLEVDLIVKEGKHYRLKDSVLAEVLHA